MFAETTDHKIPISLDDVRDVQTNVCKSLSTDLCLPDFQEFFVAHLAENGVAGLSSVDEAKRLYVALVDALYVAPLPVVVFT